MPTTTERLLELMSRRKRGGEDTGAPEWAQPEPVDTAPPPGMSLVSDGPPPDPQPQTDVRQGGPLFSITPEKIIAAANRSSLQQGLIEPSGEGSGVAQLPAGAGTLDPSLSSISSSRRVSVSRSGAPDPEMDLRGSGKDDGDSTPKPVSGGYSINPQEKTLAQESAARALDPTAQIVPSTADGTPRTALPAKAVGSASSQDADAGRDYEMEYAQKQAISDRFMARQQHIMDSLDAVFAPGVKMDHSYAASLDAGVGARMKDLIAQRAAQRQARMDKLSVEDRAIANRRADTEEARQKAQDEAAKARDATTKAKDLAEESQKVNELARQSARDKEEAAHWRRMDAKERSSMSQAQTERINIAKARLKDQEDQRALQRRAQFEKLMEGKASLLGTAGEMEAKFGKPGEAVGNGDIPGYGRLQSMARGIPGVDKLAEGLTTQEGRDNRNKGQWLATQLGQSTSGKVLTDSERKLMARLTGDNVTTEDLREGLAELKKHTYRDISSAAAGYPDVADKFFNDVPVLRPPRGVNAEPTTDPVKKIRINPDGSRTKLFVSGRQEIER